MSFGPDQLIACYAEGIFPMADSRDDPGLRLIDPELRGVIPLDRFHLSRRLMRTIRSDRFEVRTDTAFSAVVAACASPAPDRAETWISRGVEHLYGQLFARGQAHSVECWREERLVGGLYGVTLGGAFFGESMFSRETDASKVALAHLVARLIVGGYALLDTQFMTDHLAQFGTEEIPRRDYRRRLAAALPIAADFYRLEPNPSGLTALAAIGPRS
jgi:leucyl/phenylalanyl-tRNA--protein transferase